MFKSALSRAIENFKQLGSQASINRSGFTTGIKKEYEKWKQKPSNKLWSDLRTKVGESASRISSTIGNTFKDFGTSASLQTGASGLAYRFGYDPEGKKQATQYLETRGLAKPGTQGTIPTPKTLQTTAKAGLYEYSLLHPSTYLTSTAFGSVVGGAGQAVKNVWEKRPTLENIGQGIQKGAEQGFLTAPTLALTNSLVQKFANTVPMLKPLSEEGISATLPRATETIGQWLKNLGTTGLKRIIKAGIVETPIEGLVWGGLEKEENESLLNSIAEETAENFVFNIAFAGANTLWDARTIAPVLKNTLDQTISKYNLGDQTGAISPQAVTATARQKINQLKTQLETFKDKANLSPTEAKNYNDLVGQVREQNQILKQAQKAQTDEVEKLLATARKQIGEAQPEPKKPLKQKFDEFYTQWVDRYNPLVKASQTAKTSLEEQGAVLRPEYDPEYLVRRLSGAGGIADHRFKTELNPILKQMEQAQIPKLDMDTYLANKRLAGFGSVGRDIYGANPKQSFKVVQALEQKYPGIQNIAKQFYDYQDRGFRELVGSGFLDSETAKLVQKQNPDYSPLYRVMDDMDEYLGLPTRKTMQGTSPFPKIKGSKRKIESPVESIIGNTFRQRSAIEKNRVARSIVELQNIADLGFERVKKSAPDTITVWDNGQKQYWKVGQDIADVAKGTNEEAMNLVLKIIRQPASLLRQGATGRNPEFMIPNIVRDQLDAGITSKYGYIPFVDYTRGLWEILKFDLNQKYGLSLDDSVYRNWANSGAKIDLGSLSGRKSIQQMFDEKATKRTLGRWITEGLDVMGRYSEQPTRVGLYKKAYEQTGNPLLAVMESRDATVDFARMGGRMKVANSIIPFLNVGVQGFDKLIRAVKDQPAKVLMNLGLYSALPAVTTAVYNLKNYPEEYSEIPDYDKESNFVIVKGRNKNGTVDYITIPKGNVLPVVANPIENFISYIYKRDRKTFQELALSVLSDVLPVLEEGTSLKEIGIRTVGSNLPQAFKPITENLLNKSFYKYDPNRQEARDIVPYYLKNQPAYKQAYEFTPKMYQKIGAVFNVSPLQVKNLLEGYFAGYAKIPTQIVEMLSTASQGGEINPNDKTLIRRFIKQTYPSSSQAKEEPEQPELPGLMERVTSQIEAKGEDYTTGYGAKITKNFVDSVINKDKAGVKKWSEQIALSGIDQKQVAKELFATAVETKNKPLVKSLLPLMQSYGVTPSQLETTLRNRQYTQADKKEVRDKLAEAIVKKDKANILKYAQEAEKMHIQNETVLKDVKRYQAIQKL